MSRGYCYINIVLQSFRCRCVLRDDYDLPIIRQIEGQQYNVNSRLTGEAVKNAGFV